MNIGKTIKQLRRDRDMTQEQLAEYLGISAKAVSKWETDIAMPDTSLFPVIANIFDVSIDYLFDFDTTNKEKAIEEICENAHKYLNMGYRDKSAEILREGLKQYPNSYIIMGALMHSIFSNGNTNAEREEIVKLGEKILADSTNNSQRHSAIQMLCYTYPKVGKRDEAIKLAKTMPDSCLSCSSLLASIYTGKERYEQYQYNLGRYLDDLVWGIQQNNAPFEDGTCPYSTEEMIVLRKKAIDIMKIMFENEDYCFYEQGMAWTYIYIAMDYARLNDAENSLNYLELGNRHSIMSDTSADDEVYTSLVFRGKEALKGGHNTTSNDSMYQLEQMEDSVFDFIRNEPKFIEISDELKKYAEQRTVE